MIAGMFSELGFWLVQLGCALMFLACLLFVCVCIDHWRRERHYARLARAEGSRKDAKTQSKADGEVAA